MSGESWGREVFDRLYGADPDPWRFDTSPYEAGKYADTLSQLGDRRFANALELGCGNGAMSDRMAGRCDRLSAVDISPQAVSLARSRCARHARLAFHVAVLPDEFGALPPGPYNLVVISELLYFLCPADIDRLARHVAEVLAPDALLLLVNWTGETDTPCTGHEAAGRFVAAIGSEHRFDRVHHDRAGYRLDRLQRVAGQGGQ